MKTILNLFLISVLFSIGEAFSQTSQFENNWEFETREYQERVFLDTLNKVKTYLLENFDLYEVSSLESDKDGNLVLFDFTNQYKIAFIPNGDLNKIQYLGNGKGDGPMEFGNPFDLKFDHEGNIWLVDVEKYRVQKWSRNGMLLQEFKTPKYVRPSKLAHNNRKNTLLVLSEQFTPDGVLYIFDLNGDLKHSFQKPKNKETRSVLYFESELVSTKEGFIVAGGVKPFLRGYDSNGNLKYSKGIIGFKNPEKILTRNGRVTSRSKELIRATVDIQSAGNFIYLGVSGKVNERWIRIIDIYESISGDYKHSFKLIYPAKYFTIFGNKLYAIEYNWDDEKIYLSEYNILNKK
jgi:hypothetical protein